MSARRYMAVEYGWTRVFSGILIAPVVAGAAVGLALLPFGLFPAILVAPVLAGLLGWPAGLVLGLPGYVVLRRCALTGPGPYIACGLLFGVAAGLIAGAASEIACTGADAGCDGLLRLPQGWVGAASGALHGPIAGFVFWAVVRPDERETYMSFDPAAAAARKAWLRRADRDG